VPAVCPLPSRLLDVDAAASYLGISPWAIRDLLASGRLARVRLPLEGDRELRRLLFDVRDLDVLVDRSKEAPPPAVGSSSRARGPSSSPAKGSPGTPAVGTSSSNPSWSTLRPSHHDPKPKNLWPGGVSAEQV
jgi:hypothetical protein